MAVPATAVENDLMTLVGDLSVLLGLLALLAFVLFSTLKINRSRKVRGLTRRIASRLVDWK